MNACIRLLTAVIIAIFAIVCTFEHALAAPPLRDTVRGNSRVDKPEKNNNGNGKNNTSTEPTTEPVIEPTTDPVTEPTTEPVTEPTTDPVTEPTTDSSADTGDDQTASSPPPVYHIQLWDGQKTNWDPALLTDLRNAGFTIVQNGWGGSYLPSPTTLNKVTSQGLLYAAYINTPFYFRDKATAEEKAAVRYATRPDGTSYTTEYNTFCSIYQNTIRRSLADSYTRLGNTPGLYKVLFNSERNAPLSYDALTVDRAMKAGVMKSGEKIPYYNRGVWKLPSGESASDYADPYRFAQWFDAQGADRAINRAAIEISKSLRPDVCVTSDPVMDNYAYGQYAPMDVLQDWLRIHQAPRDPLAIAYRVERLKTHLRKNGGGQIWIGPQLGTSFRDGSGFGAPADVFEEGLWLSVVFGAGGSTFWGYHTIRRDSELDMDTWSRIRKFRDGLIIDRPWLVGAKDAPRDFAVLLSKANLVYTKRAYHEIDENYEHFMRSLFAAHVPADVLYDQDVLEGALSRYKAVFLPGIEYSTPELTAALAAYETGGGRVVRYPFMRILYRDYEITAGNIDENLDITKVTSKSYMPHQYREWRHWHAAQIRATVADLVNVTCDNPNVILNVVESAGVRRVVLVNDNRTYGAWTEERKYRICDDLGLESTATVTIGSGSTAKSVTVKLAPAGVAAISF